MQERRPPGSPFGMKERRQKQRTESSVQTLAQTLVNSQKLASSTALQVAKEVTGLVERAASTVSDTVEGTRRRSLLSARSKDWKGPQFLMIEGQMRQVTKLIAQDLYARELRRVCLDERFWDTEEGIQSRCTDLCYYMSLGDIFVQALCVACLLNDVSIHFKRDYRNGKGECHTSTTRAHLLNVISGMCRLHRENQNALLECGILREMHRCLEDDATSLVGLWATEALFFALMNNRSNQDQFKQWPHVHAELIRSSKKENIWGKHFSRNYAKLMLDLIYAPASKERDRERDSGVGERSPPPSSAPSVVSQKSEVSVASVASSSGDTPVTLLTFNKDEGGAIKQA